MPERTDLLFSVHRLSKDLSAPNGSSWVGLKRCGRYVKGTMEVWTEIIPLSMEEEEVALIGYSDSDYAGDRTSCRSVSCAWIELGGVPVYAHARQQSIIATSSAEAECYAMSGAAVELFGIDSILKELGVRHRVVLRSDSSSGRSLANRRGLGRMKHIDVKCLWLQECVAQQKLVLQPVKSEDNPADVGTKHVSAGRLHVLFNLLRLHVEKEAEISSVEEEQLGIASADDATFSRRDVAWVVTLACILMSVIIIRGVVDLAREVGRGLCSLRSRVVKTRSIGTQSITTYTAVRGDAHPRFTVLPNGLHGAFLQ